MLKDILLKFNTVDLMYIWKHIFSTTEFRKMINKDLYLKY